MVIGVAAGVFCYWGVTGLKRMLGQDDALDCFGVHGVGGIVGALLTGVFAINEYGGTSGLIEGNAAQMINQVKGIAVVIVYDAIVSLILLKIIDADHRPARDARSGARRSRSRAAWRGGAVARADKLAVGAETRHCPFRRGPGSQEPGASLFL